MRITPASLAKQFTVGERVTWQQSRQSLDSTGDGEIFSGVVLEKYRHSEDYRNGGLYRLQLDDGDTVEAWCAEIEPEVPGPSQKELAMTVYAAIFDELPESGEAVTYRDLTTRVTSMQPKELIFGLWALREIGLVRVEYGAGWSRVAADVAATPDEPNHSAGMPNFAVIAADVIAAHQIDLSAYRPNVEQTRSMLIAAARAGFAAHDG